MGLPNLARYTYPLLALVADTPRDGHSNSDDGQVVIHRGPVWSLTPSRPDIAWTTTGPGPATVLDGTGLAAQVRAASIELGCAVAIYDSDGRLLGCRHRAGGTGASANLGRFDGDARDAQPGGLELESCPWPRGRDERDPRLGLVPAPVGAEVGDDGGDVVACVKAMLALVIARPADRDDDPLPSPRAIPRSTAPSQRWCGQPGGSSGRSGNCQAAHRR